MLNRAKIICAVMLFFTNISFSFALDSAKLVEKGKETCVVITAEFKLNNIDQPIIKRGTGFVIDTKKSPGLIIVTNKHILEHKVKGGSISPYKITAKVNLSEVEHSLYNARIIGLHDSYDIGLLYPGNLVKIPKDAELKTTDDIQYYKWKTMNFILEDSILDDADIKEGLEVFFSGYPLNLGTEKFKNYPITRKGTIAQAIPGEKEFIMDGFSSHGNSGSPVYCLFGDSIKLLGIQRGVYNDANIGYDENGNVSSLVSFNSGLSIVIKATVIKDFVYELIDKGKYKGDWSN